jgi:hypothetical protein
MRIISIIVVILGVATLAFGILFLMQAGSAEKQIADSVAPLKLSEVNAKYDAAAAKYDALKVAEEPQIQAGKAAPTTSYLYISGQRALLGLAKSNVGTAKFVRTSGTVNIIIGLGLVVVGLAMMVKKTE